MKPVNPVPGATLPTRGSRSYLYQRSASRLHRGIDLFAPRGTPVLAPVDGRVQQAFEGWQRGFTGYGSSVVLRTEQPRRWLLFAHLDEVDVRPGQQVRQGEQLGTVGTSAGTRSDPSAQFRSSKPHMHWEVSRRPYPLRRDAPRESPLAWLREAIQETADQVRQRPVASAGGAGAVLGLVVLWLLTTRKS